MSYFVGSLESLSIVSIVKAISQSYQLTRYTHMYNETVRELHLFAMGINVLSEFKYAVEKTR